MAQNPYHVILIGCGVVARKHLKSIALLNDRLQLVGVVDPNKEQAEHHIRAVMGSASIPVHETLESLVQALEENNIEPDVAAITTPSGTHYELAKDCIIRRYPVILEKPMTLDLGQAKELLELAEEHDVPIVMGHIYRYFPMMDLLHEDISTGKFGKVYSGSVQVHWGHSQTYYDQSAWRGTWAQDGGALMNQTIHACDLMCWLMDDEPISVQGQIRQLTHRMEAEDHGMAILSLSTGAMCMIEGTTNTSPSHQSAEFSILTEEAEIYAGIRSGKPYFKIKTPDGHDLTKMYRKRFFKQLRTKGFFKGLKMAKLPHSGLYQDMIQALDTGDQPRANGESGLNAVEIILAIYKSAKLNGKPIHLPLDDFGTEDMSGFFETHDGYGMHMM